MTTLQLRLLPLESNEIDLADDEDNVRGLVVLDAHDRRVGEVDDIVVDDVERRGRLLVVASGGVLGLGSRRHLVPVEAVAHVSDHVRLHHMDEEVLAADEYDPTLRDAVDFAPVYDYYGCMPFWQAGHRSTYFHDRRS
ncbi:PRC-barrel domain-containing protein [Nocardioides sediminis]|uniref:PRC-barrel domain-containing protein n=1 Tax=Nocardioides sediminis TaxID=433648 RepID=UPI000D2F9791|nr:PRC-barrel domain-containing protein [Nocardioides sediminis]